MNNFSYVWPVILAFCCLIAALWSVLRVNRALESLREAQPCSVSRIKSIEASLEELQGAITEVANRVKMMRVRSAANHVSDKSAAPDPYREPDAWRRHMEKQLRK